MAKARFKQSDVKVDWTLCDTAYGYVDMGGRGFVEDFKPFVALIRTGPRSGKATFAFGKGFNAAEKPVLAKAIHQQKSI